MFLKESCAHLRRAYLSEFLSYSFSMLYSKASGAPPPVHLHGVVDDKVDGRD